MTQPTGPPWPYSPDPPPAPRRSRIAAIAAAAVAAIVLVVAVVVVTTLATDDGSSSSSPQPLQSPSTLPPNTSATVSISTDPANLDEVLGATIASLYDYWSQEFPKVYGKPWTKLSGGYQPKTPSSPPWTCGGQRVTYQDVEGNAFYCGGPNDDYIAYDAAQLLPTLDKNFGALAPAVVIAHETGHAVQARAGVRAPSIVVELQADCFAGAWTKYAQSSSGDPVAIDSSALDRAVRAILLLRDQVGTPATQPGAHGLAFDRVNAFQTGYDRGADRCSTFAQGHVVTTELPFSTPQEAATGGNLPFNAAVPLFVRLLNSYWSSSIGQLSSGPTFKTPSPDAVGDLPLPDCAGDTGYDSDAVVSYCQPANRVSFATAPLSALHAKIGDMATGTALSESWARAAQAQAGLPTTGLSAELQQVCLTGAWVGSIGADNNAKVQLSPGDIDEVLFTVLTPLASDQTSQVIGTTFERADALRTGILNGIGSCTH
jgi:predicted metalloprotease